MSEIDEILAAITAQRTHVMDAEDRAFCARVLDSVTTGSMGVFVVLHPNDRMQYLVMGTSGLGAVALLAKVLQRIVEAQAPPEDEL